MAVISCGRKNRYGHLGAGNAGTDAESRYAGLYNNEDGSGDNALPQKRKVSSTDMVENKTEKCGTLITVDKWRRL